MQATGAQDFLILYAETNVKRTIRHYVSSFTEPVRYGAERGN